MWLINHHVNQIASAEVGGPYLLTECSRLSTEGRKGLNLKAFFCSPY